MFNSEKGIWIKYWLWKFYIQNVLHILSVIMIFPVFFLLISLNTLIYLVVPLFLYENDWE